MNAETPLAESDLADAAKWRKRRRIRGVLMLLAPLVVIVGSVWFYLTGGRYELTENAQLQTGMVNVSASVAGKVQSVNVRENQKVSVGQVLFTVGSDTAAANFAEAEAQLAVTRTDIGTKQADYAESLTAIRAAQAKLAFAQREAARQGALVKEGIASRAQYDAALLEVQTARDAIVSAQAHSEAVRAELAGGVDGAPARGAQGRGAGRAGRGSRSTMRSYAPRSTAWSPRSTSCSPAHYVTPGRPVFMLTATRYWVTANFKENQLRYMRVGQPATIKIDAFPDHELKGHVESFSPGTGNAFSILPAENATGNWVKVVQRLPVQIAIDQVPAGMPLHMGLSAPKSRSIPGTSGTCSVRVWKCAIRRICGPARNARPRRPDRQ